MPGIRSFNFREGDRSEYLANYLLSGLGLVTPVPRQEDIGFDFYCQLADQEKGILTFSYPFIVQVKSDSVSSLGYGSINMEEWKVEHINWIYKLELPFFIGIIDKKALQIDIFNCSALRFLIHENVNPTRIELNPRIPSSEGDIGRPSVEEIPGWADFHKGDGKKYSVDLGNALVTIANNDFNDLEKLAHKKNLLRHVVALEQQNILFQKLRLPHFYWIHRIDTNDKFVPAWMYYFSSSKQVLSTLYQTLGPGLISLAVTLRANDQETLVNHIKPLLKEIPKSIIHPELKNIYPDLFLD